MGIKQSWSSSGAFYCTAATKQIPTKMRFVFLIFVTLVMTSLAYADEETTTVADESEYYENDEPMYDDETIADEETEMEDATRRRHHVKFVAPKKVVTKIVPKKVVTKKIVLKKKAAPKKKIVLRVTRPKVVRRKLAVRKVGKPIVVRKIKII